MDVHVIRGRETCPARRGPRTPRKEGVGSCMDFRLRGNDVGTCCSRFANSADAHTGAEHALSFASGFAHPWTGLDHMLAMVAVGLWAGLNGGRALWAWPASFVGVMLAAARSA